MVTALPIGALLGAQFRGGEPAVRAAAGCLLVAGGVLTLAWLPDAQVWWTIAPQVVGRSRHGPVTAGARGELLPERTAHDAAVLLTIRHADRTGLLVLIWLPSPPTSSTHDDRRRAPAAAWPSSSMRPFRPRTNSPSPPISSPASTPNSPATPYGTPSPPTPTSSRAKSERRTTRWASRADQVLVSAVSEAFKPAFLLAGAAGLLAAALLAAGAQLAAMAAATALTLGTPAAYYALHKAIAPAPPAIQDPCHPDRTPPKTGGISGFIQEQALKLLDSTACKLGSSREELVLALADKDEAKRFEREHGVDPRTAAGLLSVLLK